MSERSGIVWRWSQAQVPAGSESSGLPSAMECGSTKPSELAAAGVEPVRVRAADTRDERRNAMPKITFIERDGNRREVEAPVGLSILEIAHRNSIDIEGACEGSLACSTCHVIVAPEDFERLPDAAEEEEDMLDLAWGLTKTSRLGCQIIITEELDGLTVSLPSEVHNALID